MLRRFGGVREARSGEREPTSEIPNPERSERMRDLFHTKN
jgi:hypothetical protein